MILGRDKELLKKIGGPFIKDEEYKKELIIKPTIDTSMGKNIMTIEDRFNNKKEVKSILNTCNKNFICQETIKQHKDLSSLNPDCVNTIRIMSLLYNNKVYKETF